MVARCICLGCLIISNCWCVAQTVDTSFILLWYKGKKLNDTILLTPSGQTVTYRPSKGNANVTTPPKNDIFNNVKKSIDNIEQRKTAISRRIVTSQHGTLLAGFVFHVNRSLDQAAARAEKLTTTTVQFVDEEFTRPPPEAFQRTDIPREVEQLYLEVMTLTNAIRQDPFPPTPPPPPSMSPDYCFPCDAQRQAVYKRDSIAFMSIMAEEQAALQKALVVLRFLLQYDLYSINEPPPGDKERMSRMDRDIREAMPVLFRHIGRKLHMAWTTYSSDPTKIMFLVDVCSAHIRQQQLTGFPIFPGFPNVQALIKRSVEAGRETFAEAMSKRDYRILLNINWVCELFAMPEMFGMELKEFEYGIENIININKFKVTVHAKSKLHKEEATMGATMYGESVFGAIPDSNCILKWVLLEPDSSKMLYKLEEASMQLRDKKPSYIGTRKWKSYPADFRLDFCKEEKDTAMLFGFFPFEGQEEWVVDGKSTGVAAIVSTVFTTSFMDIKRLKAMAADPNLQARMHDEMMKKYEEFKKNFQGNKDPSKMTPQEMEQMTRAMTSAREMKSILHPMLPTSFLLRGKLKNNAPVIFDQKLNGKELFPENDSIAEAILTLKIEHLGNTTKQN